MLQFLKYPLKCKLDGQILTNVIFKRSIIQLLFFRKSIPLMVSKSHKRFQQLLLSKTYCHPPAFLRNIDFTVYPPLMKNLLNILLLSLSSWSSILTTLFHMRPLHQHRRHGNACHLNCMIQRLRKECNCGPII